MKKVFVLTLIGILVIFSGCSTDVGEAEFKTEYQLGETADILFDYYDYGRINKRVTVVEVIRGTNEVYELIGEPNMWYPGEPRHPKEGGFRLDPDRFVSVDEYIFVKVRVEMVDTGSWSSEYNYKRDLNKIDGFWIESTSGEDKTLLASNTALQPELIANEISIEEGEIVEFWINNLVSEDKNHYLFLESINHPRLKFHLF